MHAGGKKMSFEEYSKKFKRFHTRYTLFKFGGIGLYTFGNLFHSQYTKGMGFAWTETNFNPISLLVEFAWSELINMFLIPQGTDCASNIRAVYVATALFVSMTSSFEVYEVLLCARYAKQALSPLIMSSYLTSSRTLSPTKAVLYDALFNFNAGVFWHIPYLIDVLSFTNENHEPYMCSLSLHMSIFKFFASVPFAIYNNVDSPFRNSRALVVLPWVLFDFPSMILLMVGCAWNNSLVYGIDTTPNLFRVVPIGLAGAAHVWLFAMIPFLGYDLCKKIRARPATSNETGAAMASLANSRACSRVS